MLRLRALACAVALVAANSVFGQAVVEETPNGLVAAPAPEVQRMSQILGSTVALQGNNNFGKIDDVVLSPNGTISHVVVNNGGRYAMLPWSAGNFNYGRRMLTYGVAPQAIEPLYFAQNAWPNVMAPEYTQRMTQIFPNAGITRREVMRPVPATVPAPGPNVVKEKVKVRRDGSTVVKERVR